MSRNGKIAREKANEWIRRTDNLSKVLQMSKAMQTRFVLIPKAHLNNVTVAGVKDMKLGKVKNGKPVGRNVIRFNNPSVDTKSDFHRICIDPKGLSNKNNPHIPVSAGTVRVAETMQKGLQITGKALLVISLVTSGIRVGKAIYDEVTIDDEIAALEQMVDCLEEDLRADTCTGSERSSTRDALDHARVLLNKAYHNKKNKGEKTLLTIVCIGGEFGGAAACGFGGAEAGAAIGIAGGPVGMVTGAIVGSVAGAIVGSELGRSAIENFKCDDDGLSTALYGSLIDWGKGKNVQGQVLGFDGDASVGRNGVELGVHGTLFEIGKKEDANFSVLKTGANCDLNSKGVDVGVEGKVLRLEAENDAVKVGFGLNLDTGFKIGSDGAKVEFLGIGFSAGDDGVGFKLPFFDMKFK